jgi:hypothetical protein
MMVSSNRSNGSRESSKGPAKIYGPKNVLAAFATALALLKQAKIAVPLLVYL